MTPNPTNPAPNPASPAPNPTNPAPNLKPLGRTMTAKAIERYDAMVKEFALQLVGRAEKLAEELGPDSQICEGHVIGARELVVRAPNRKTQLISGVLLVGGGLFGASVPGLYDGIAQKDGPKIVFYLVLLVVSIVMSMWGLLTVQR